MASLPPLSDPEGLAEVPVPQVVALSLWTASYLRGECGPDDAAQAARGVGHRPVEHLGTDLFAWMTEVRRLPMPTVRAVLPEPGRIAGPIGPPTAITAALEAGQALVVAAAGLGEHTFIPRTEVIGSEGARSVVFRWEVVPGTGQSVPPPVVGGAMREQFLRALQRAASSSLHLDLVPEEAIAAAHLPPDWTVIHPPRGMDPQAVHLLILAARTVLLADAELEELSDPTDTARTGAVGLHAQSARHEVLRELRDAARGALLEVCAAASAT